VVPSAWKGISPRADATQMKLTCRFGDLIGTWTGNSLARFRWKGLWIKCDSNADINAWPIQKCCLSPIWIMLEPKWTPFIFKWVIQAWFKRVSIWFGEESVDHDFLMALRAKCTHIATDSACSLSQIREHLFFLDYIGSTRMSNYWNKLSPWSANQTLP